MKNIAIFGSTGAIGQALIVELAQQYPTAHIHGISRSVSSQSVFANHQNVQLHTIDLQDETALARLAKQLTAQHKLDYVFVATGTLHTDSIQPEKSLRQLSAKNFEHLFAVNTILPAIIAKHFIPTLNKTSRSVFAVLSARVGSISDNGLGGWYAYRASKAALNMLIKTASIENKRRNPNAVIVSLHPGTVDSALSKPFQKNVPAGKLFTAKFSAQSLIKVTDKLTEADTGKCFAWDGAEIAA